MIDPFMKRPLIQALAFTFFVWGAASCCINCKDNEPAKGGLDLNISTDLVDSVEVSVYKGREVRKGELLFEAALRSDTSIIVPRNKSFSGEAVYKKFGKTAVAVDRDEFEVDDRSENCDDRDTCYVIKEGDLDLTLERDPF